MSAVTPNDLRPYATSGIWHTPTWSYKWRLSEPGYELFDLWNGSSWYSTTTNLSIKVSTSNGVWSDGGESSPTSVIDDGTTVFCSTSDYPDLYTFTKPTVASWISTAPPPNTNSVSDVFVSYVVEDNELRVYIPLDKPSTVHPNPDPAGRDLYYQLRKVSGTSFFVRIVHTQGTPTNETIVPTTAGIYQLEKVQTNPTVYTTYDTAEVSQAQLDFYATNNPPDDDPPENDPPPTPVFIRGSGRGGNLNFW